MKILFQHILQLWLRLLSLLRRGRHEREMDEEMRFHLQMQIEQNLASGMAPEEARFAARRQFGNQTWLKEVSREMWSLNLIETLIQDLRYGVRMLLKNPGFTLVAVITLALGIGATTAIFSVVNGVLLKPLPYHQPEALASVRLTAQRLSVKDWALSASNYFIFREQSDAFQDIGLYQGNSVDVTGLGEPERTLALVVTDGLLPILGVTPLLGRSFTREDDSPGSAETVILTYGYWRRRFGGDRSIIGRTIEVDGKPRAIIGILSEDFRSPDQSTPAMLLPLKLDREQTFLGNFGYLGIARLKPGVTMEQASADVARMLPIVNRSFPTLPAYPLKLYEDARFGPNLRPLKQEVVGDVGKVLWILLGGISLVLVIACANVANFLLVRAEGRRQELAIRAALGASRGRIAAQLLFESLILAAFGGLFGLGLAYGAARVLIALAPQGLPRLNEIGVDGYVALFTLGMSIVAGLLFGAAPVFKFAGAEFGIGLREPGRSMSEGRERRRSRGILVIVQVALALVLLVSSGLMIRTFLALTEVNPGFISPAEVQTFGITIMDTRAPDAERVIQIEKEILQKLEVIPGVSSASISKHIPMDGKRWQDVVYTKNSASTSDDLPLRRFHFIAPGFFNTLGTPLLAGRDITWSDIYNYNKVPVAIVSENLAREYWRDPASAIGKQFRASQNSDGPEIVGVVGNVRQDGVNKEAPTSVYWPMRNIYAIRDVTFVIRSPRAGSEGLINEIRQAVWSVAPDIPVSDVRTLNDYYTRSMARTSFTLVMLAIAGSMALFLGVVGIYGVIAYSVSQRRREIGIRMALGAEKSAILSMIIGQGIKLVLIGVGIGLGGALGLTRFLSGLLYGVKPGDPLTLVAVSALLIAVALLASYIPARQAAKVDPMVALRHD